MINIFTVDKTTRIFLPDTLWGFSVRECLTQLGHEIEFSGPAPAIDDRPPEELARRDQLLEEVDHIGLAM